MSICAHRDKASLPMERIVDIENLVARVERHIQELRKVFAVEQPVILSRSHTVATNHVILLGICAPLIT
jgi:hypothetical protein